MPELRVSERGPEGLIDAFTDSGRHVGEFKVYPPDSMDGTRFMRWAQVGTNSWDNRDVAEASLILMDIARVWDLCRQNNQLVVRPLAGTLHSQIKFKN